MQVVLVMFRSDGERRSFSVVRDITVLGRREDCDLRIPLSDISRKHCRLIRSGQSVRIEDLGSSNGTLCNGERISSVELQPGDVLGVGPVTFVVQIDGVPSDEEMNPNAPAQQDFAAHDTNAAVAAVGVGAMHEVGPADADSMADEPLIDADELDEVQDFGAAPLVAQDADDEVAELEPVADLEPVEEVEELEPVKELEAIEEDELTPVAELEEITDFDEAPAPPSARPAAPVPAAPTPPTVKAAPKPVAPPKPLAKPAKPAPVPQEEPVAEVVYGELAAEESEAVDGEPSEFDIIMDDEANASASGELNIDWSEESKSGR